MGTPELVYCRRALVDTLKPHRCWGPNGVSVWLWQGGASRTERKLAGGQPLSLFEELPVICSLAVVAVSMTMIGIML
jgi:hypothetical protein